MAIARLRNELFPSPMDIDDMATLAKAFVFSNEVVIYFPCT